MNEPLVNAPRSTMRIWIDQTLPFLLAGVWLAGLIVLNDPLLRAQSILKGPYLQNVSPSSIVIMWETDSAVPSLVRYRPQGKVPWSSAFEPDSIALHEIELTGLPPQTAFEYQASSNGSDAWTPSETFRTAPTVDQTVRLAVYGDTRSDPDSHRAVVRSIITSTPDIVLHVGDLVNDGNVYAEWAMQFFAPAAQLIAHTPLFPVLGNHERHSSHYFNLFSLPGNEQWYASTYGPARLIGLDSEADFSPSSAQYSWLVNELQSPEYDAAAFQLVFLHRPPYTSGNHQGDVGVQTWLVPLFEQHGVDAVLAGHNHHYERSLKDGIYYIVTGGGGAPLYGFPNSNPFSQVREQAYHHVTLDIGSTFATLAAWHTDGTAFDAVPLSSAPVVGKRTTLYNGALNTGTPDTQRLAYQTSFLASATQAFAGGVTTLDTTAVQGDQAGYLSLEPITLDRGTGFAIRFTVQVISETHASANRAGFSIIALSNDRQGIELGFWENEIWAQEGGSPPSLFTHAESTTFDTTTGLIPYQLDVLGNLYTLSTGDTLLLSGPLRDYTAFAGFPDVYETPNLLFLGDDTSSAQARVGLSSVSVITSAAPAKRTVSSGGATVIDDLGVFDLDAMGQDLTLTLGAGHGALTVTTGIAGGLSSGDIAGNGTNNVVVTGTVGKINATLAHTSPLLYRGDLGFLGTDVVTITLTDGDNAVSTRHIYIRVYGAVLHLRKTVNDVQPRPGERITYTVVVSNADDIPATAAVISDTLSEQLHLARVVQLDPPSAGTVGTAPHIITGLTITPGHQVTVTLTVTVNENLTYGTQITNTVTLTHPHAPALVSDSQPIYIDRPITGIHLDKTASNALPRSGERITYTIAVFNASDDPVTDAVISDTLSGHLHLAGSIQLEPPNAGTVNAMPRLVTGLTVTPWHQITVTFAVTVGQHLSIGTQITNTATLTYPLATTLLSDLVTITVPYHTYIPSVPVDSVDQESISHSLAGY